jgi:hypothetical protein
MGFRLPNRDKQRFQKARNCLTFAEKQAESLLPRSEQRPLIPILNQMIPDRTSPLFVTEHSEW